MMGVMIGIIQMSRTELQAMIKSSRFHISMKYSDLSQNSFANISNTNMTVKGYIKWETLSIEIT